MTTSVAELPRPSPRVAWLARRSEQLARRLVLSKLERLRHGRLHFIEGSEERVFGHDDELVAHLRVDAPSFYPRLAFGGSVGAGESYMSAEWRSDDLTSLVRLMVRNIEALDHFEGGTAWLTEPLRRTFHALRRNSKTGSRHNVMAHYDLSNDFYELFLDPTMMYSAAIFERRGMTLEEASTAKLEQICRKLGLGPGDRVLEIGTGWGGFAVHAARHHGCHVTSTTLSPSQARYARQRIAREGLEDQVKILEVDYRDLQGRFDKLVSIEMIEAVGLDHLDTFFRVCGERLEDDGQMLLQSITIVDHRFESASRSVDFIQRYIFPGSAIPSIGALAAAVARASDLTIRHLEDIGLHYAATLRAWRQRFSSRLEAVRRLGFSDRFIRMWEFYLCYCEGGFLEGQIGDAQIVLTKPRARPLLEVIG